MTKKRIYAAITAAACVTSTFAVMPQSIGQANASEIVYNGFEQTYGGWHGTDNDVDMHAENGAGFEGSRGMVISERTSADQGAASSKGLYLWGGVKYNYSVKVYTEKDDVFHITLRTVDMNTGEENIVKLVDKAVKGGEWTDLSASYKAPKDSAEFEVVITTDSTEDFAFDDFTVEGSSGITAEAAEQGLKDEFADYFRVGNILNGSTVNNSGIKGIILKDHNAIECENETKPDATIVQNGSSNTNVKVSLSRCAAICDFAAENGIAFRGHTLVWHSQTPEWFFKEGFSNDGSYVNSATMDQRMESYIKNMFAAYATQYPTLNLFAYDVCNEVINDGTASQGGLRPTNGTNGQNGSSAWVRVYGNNSFVEKAFTYARKYAPAGCKLFYNDYNEFAGDKKSCIINTILKPLKEKGLIDGMGMQSHVSAASGQYDWGGTPSYLAAMDEYLSLGIDVQVTELDISTEGGKFSLQDQATKYKAIFQHAVDVNTSGKYAGKVTLVQVWGPNDNNSWVATDKQSGRSNAPLLYDGSNQPKAAYTAITSIIPQPWGNGSEYSGDGGTTPVVTLPDEDGNYFHSTFESSVDGWSGRVATVDTSGSQHYEGSKSLYVSGRESAWNGAQHSLSTLYFKPGEEYSFSVNVMHTTASTDPVHYMMKIQYSDGTDTQYDEVASGDIPAGAWGQLANTNYKIPAGASDIQIYVETEDSINDFYIDDMYASTAGTAHSGAGVAKVKKVTPGDLNFDGVCDAFDMPLARKYVVSGNFEDDMMKKAADVDKSGKYEVNDLVLIDEFLLGKIDTFPKVTPPVDFDALEAKFSGVQLAESFKKETENNPIYTQRFGADPGWLVYDGRLYVYTTADEFVYKNGGIVENDYSSGYINCLSTADLVNWTDHGQIPVAKTRTTGAIAKWANNAWAPDAAWKNIGGQDKFFLYFANNGSGIGVLTADDPTFTKNVRDPLGHELISRNTPNSNVVWLFDPGVYYDPDTDTGIIAYGGGVNKGQEAWTKQGRIAKLGEDMISIVGTPIDPGTPYLFEDSSMIKIGDTWYYSFCHNWDVPGGTNVNGHSFSNADIGYMTSKNPLADYEYQGVVFQNTGSQRLDNGGNNHHSIIEFKGSYYVLYHSRQLEMRMGVNGGRGQNYRSPCIDKATLNGGKLSCSGSQTGVSQIEKLNAYETVQAETMSNQSKNISVNGVGNTTVVMKKGEWIKVSGVDLSKGVDSITGKGKGTGVIKICAGSVNGTVIGYINLDGSGDESTLPAKESITGSKDIYLIASGDVELDYWFFS